MDLRRPSGALAPYKLTLTARGSQVQVRERSPHRLPAMCPERHINLDGSFCMHWMEGDPREVIDAESARGWWRLLWDFLERQETAAKLGKWPGKTCAHGIAARHQARAEGIAAGFGPAFVRDLDAGEFEAKQVERHTKRRIELRRHGELVNRIGLPKKTLTNLTHTCPCDDATASGRNVGQCGTHAHGLAELIDELYRWGRGESQFNADLMKRGTRCCGSLLACPLK